MEVHRGFGNPQFVGDLLIAMAVAYQPEHIQFASRQVFLARCSASLAAISAGTCLLPPWTERITERI